VAPTYDLALDQGATWRQDFVYRYISGGTAASPTYTSHDITGCIARMHIRQRVGLPILVALTTANGGVLFGDPVEGEFTINISDEQTDTLALKRAVYDLELEYPSGDVVRLLQGKILISPNVTVE
jgi:hypothetical protein